VGKALLAFAAGVALTVLAFVFLDDADQGSSTEPSLNETSVSTSPFIPESAAEVEVSDGPADAVSPSTQAQNVRLTNDQPGSLRDLTREQLEAMVIDGKRSADLAEKELERRQRSERWANEPPATFPFVLPPEFGWLADDPLDYHEGLQREPIDPAWSPMVEAQLRSYFAERREITERYGNPTINCRRSGCEIAFVAYGIDNSGRVTADAARAGTTPDFFTDEDFRIATADFADQPWTREFLNRYFAPYIETVNGATTFLVFLARLRPPQE